MKKLMLLFGIFALAIVAACDKPEPEQPPVKEQEDTVLIWGDISVILQTMERGRSEDAETVFLYTPEGEKYYFEVMKDYVIIEAEQGYDTRNFINQPALLHGHTWRPWTTAEVVIDPNETDLDDITQMPGVADATYLLLYAYGEHYYPTNRIYVEFKNGITPEEALEEVGLTENIVSIELKYEKRNGYGIILNVKLNEIINICNTLYEFGLCTVAEPSFVWMIKQMPQS